ncbi:hypothetical protein [Vibrio europaeus]|uniref:hypothetical protein n=1 Tax=Vibrio europaeus TaxID=300876 RepID=UPI00233E6321|nr:hypothetical protein [Vibrio europaeus]MDC5711158.1 hypothetical protein [Vibrio europaeus]MDC5713187.1 hypothetical protein [Vibrio europaeus]
MIVSNQAVFTNEKDLAKHRKKFTCQYEKVFEDEGRYFRYYSDEPTTAKGEAIRSLLKEQGDFNLLVYLEELENGYWYITAFNNDQVIGERVDDIETLIHLFGYEMQQSDKILVAKGVFTLHGDKQAEVVPIDESKLEGYALQEVKQTPIAKIALGIAAVLLSIGLILIASWETPEPKTIQVVEVQPTPKQLYIDSYKNKVKASEVLENAVNLLMEASLMPEPMASMSVMLDGSTLVMPFDDGGTRDKIKRDWLHLHSNLGALFNPKESVFKFELSKGMNWELYSSAMFEKKLIDYLQLMQVDIHQVNQVKLEDIYVHTYEISLSTGELGELPLIAELLDAPNITSNSMQLVIDRQSAVKSLVMSIDVQGIIQ